MQTDSSQPWHDHLIASIHSNRSIDRFGPAGPGGSKLAAKEPNSQKKKNKHFYRIITCRPSRVVFPQKKKTESRKDTSAHIRLSK